MRFLPPPLPLAFIFPLVASASNLVLVNDDGWAELNIRTFYNALTAAGESVLVSAPAENQSGTGSREGRAKAVTSGCEFASCPDDSPPIGANTTSPRFNYINSYPVTAMKYGVQNLSQTIFSGCPPDLVVSGPNVGSNLGIQVPFSGTAGAASAAPDQLSIPGIAFSGSTGTQIAWNTVPIPDYSLLYADLATNLTSTILASGPPYLPNGTWLNVNFPAAGKGTGCTQTSDFQFVMSRIFPALPVFGAADVVTCENGGRLPLDSTVVGTKGGCFVSVSVGQASNKFDVGEAEQAVVLGKLGGFLSCLPAS